MSDEKPKSKPKVVSITQAPKPVSTDCVELFGALLEASQKGEVIEACVVWIQADGESDNERTGIGHVAQILGELRLVGDELSAAAREE